MPALEMTIQRAQRDDLGRAATWPVTFELRLPQQPPRRVAGALQPPDGWLESLLAQSSPAAYGQALGEALFQGELRDLFRAAVAAAAGDTLHLLLVIEDADLQALQWEWLAAPLDAGGWDLLAHQQQLPLSRSLPSASGRQFAPLGRPDLRALVVLANPPAGNPHNVARFDEQAVHDALEAALGPTPVDFLGTLDGALDLPTLPNLRKHLTLNRYALLHVVAHGSFSQRAGQSQTALHLLDDRLQLTAVEGKRLETELRRLQNLPHFIFFTACESAERSPQAPQAGLAQQLVGNLGIPAVIAMTRLVSMSTANALAAHFYPRLQDHGYPDRALAEARSALFERLDVLVPALYSRLEDRPLFDDDAARPPTAGEVEQGLTRLRAELARRAPTQQELPGSAADILLAHADPAVRQDEPRKAAAWNIALEEIDALARGVLDVGFAALARNAPLPPYDDRCPFPGSGPFSAADAPFYFGREALIDQALSLLTTEQRITVVGPAGSGKSSLLAAGVAPRLGETEVVLFTPPDQPLDPVLTAVAGPTLLVIDPGERLFTALDAPQRLQLAAQLQTLPDHVRVALVLRDTAVELLQDNPALAPWAAAPRLVVPPLPPPALRANMEKQAAAVRLRFEAGLAERLLDDVAAEPGALPLLQAALRRLWERRYGAWLRLADYLALGGADGVAVALAETALTALDGDRAHIRQLFVRLARVEADPARATGRRLALVDLAPGSRTLEQARALVNRLADARLVATTLTGDGAMQVAVAHEALLRQWPTCQQWLRDDAAFLRRWQLLYPALLQWRQAAEDDSVLLRGRALREAQALVDDFPTDLTSGERNFIAAGAAAERAAGARRQSALRTRAALLGFAGGAVGYGLTTFLLYNGSGDLALRLFLGVNLALYGGVAGLILFLLLDPRLVRDLDRASTSDWLRAAVSGGVPLALLLLVDRFLTGAGENPLLGFAGALLGGLAWGGVTGAGILWRAIGNRPVWTLLPFAIAAGLLFALAETAFDLLPLAGGPLPWLWIGGTLLPLALLLAAALPERAHHDRSEE